MKKKNSIFKNHLLIVLGGGVHQMPYIKFCKKNKISTVVIDQNKNCPAKKYTDYFLNISTPNRKSIRVYNAILDITKKNKVSGVLVAGIELAILGSFIANKFNTKGIDLSTAINATLKINRARKLKKFRVPYPKFKVIKNINSINQSYPYVIKTNEGSGARGVRIIFSKKDLILARKEFIFKASKKFLLEEYLEGTEISIEAFIYQNKFNYYCFAIRDIEIISGGKIIENGSIFDPLFSKIKINEVKKVFENACSAIGLKEGPVKGDILLTKNGPKIIEVASRSAPLAPLISKKVYGFDMISAHVKWAIGINPMFSAKLKDISKSRTACHRYLLHKEGELKNIIGISSLKKSKSVIKIVLLKDLKFPLQLSKPNNINRLLYIVTTGKNVNIAKRNAINALSKVKLSYKNNL